MFNFWLFYFFNIFKIKRILPKSKAKYKAVVLQKLGGNEDLYSGQEKFNKEILYYSCPRDFQNYI